MACLGNLMMTMMALLLLCHALQQSESRLVISHLGTLAQLSFPELTYEFISASFAELVAVPITAETAMPAGVTTQLTKSGNTITVVTGAYPANTVCRANRPLRWSPGDKECIAAYRLVSQVVSLLSMETRVHVNLMKTRCTPGGLLWVRILAS
jgi:hypothetical protein